MTPCDSHGLQHALGLITDFVMYTSVFNSVLYISFNYYIRSDSGYTRGKKQLRQVFFLLNMSLEGPWLTLVLTGRNVSAFSKQDQIDA